MGSDALRLLVDSREPSPHPWAAHWAAAHVRGTITTGDISLPGCERLVCIERKTTDDLISCLTTNRDRFSRELARAQAIPHFWVVCEGSYSDLLAGRYRSAMDSRAAFQSVVALMTRYRVPFLMAGPVRVAAELTESLLLKWYREHIKVVELVTKNQGVYLERNASC